MSILSLLAANLLFGALAGSVVQSPDRGSNHGQTPMLIYFRSDDCTTCTEFDALFEQADLLQRMEEQFMPVRVSIDDSTGRACANIYKVTHIPAVVIADPGGTILYKSDASLSVAEITRLLDSVPGQFTDVSTASSDAEPIISTRHPEEINKEIADKETGKPELGKTTQIIRYESDQPFAANDEVPKAIPVNTKHTESLTAPSPFVPAEADTSNEKPVENPVAELVAPKLKPKETVSSKVPAHKPLSHATRRYAIQLGYFSEEANARKFVQKVTQKGLAETRTETELRNGISYYRVLIGECNSLTEAQKVLAEVHRLGLKGAIHRQ